MDKPTVLEVRGGATGVSIYWRVTLSDQRQFYLSKSKYPDELAAYVRVTEMIDEEERNYGNNPRA